jgi:F0F1-type ATP synthase membrane subunit b/b'
MTAQDNKPMDRLVAAYEKMLERAHETFERAESHMPSLTQNLQQAREKAVELGELTREEADRVSSYIERDMQDAATYIVETGQQMRDWWQSDLQQMERQMWDMFAAVADQTSLQMKQMSETLRQASLYHAGEITGPGILVCTGCEKTVRFEKPAPISPCEDCGGTEFRREAAAD